MSHAAEDSLRPPMGDEDRTKGHSSGTAIDKHHREEPIVTSSRMGYQRVNSRGALKTNVLHFDVSFKVKQRKDWTIKFIPESDSSPNGNSKEVTRNTTEVNSCPSSREGRVSNEKVILQRAADVVTSGETLAIMVSPIIIRYHSLL